MRSLWAYFLCTYFRGHDFHVYEIVNVKYAKADIEIKRCRHCWHTWIDYPVEVLFKKQYAKLADNVYKNHPVILGKIKKGFKFGGKLNANAITIKSDM